MNVIVATEGDSEIVALPEILKAVRRRADSLSPRVLKVSCQPDGPARHIAKATHSILKIASAKRADVFVLVLDREQRAEAAGAVAAEVLAEVQRLGNWPFTVSVVMKDRTFENWLIADLGALRKQRARFSVTEALVKRVEPDKADRVHALELLNTVVNGKNYDKKSDGKNIAARMDIDAAALHSRSFRHFLHVLGHSTYEDQCRRPVAAP